MKGIKFSEYFKVIKPEYIFIKLKPNNSIRNQSTHNLARSISSLYRSVYRSIKKEEEKVLNILGRDFGIPIKYSYQMPSKVSYYIFIEKKKVEFYFIIPKHHYTIIKEKIGDVWKNITIDEVKEIPQFSEKSLKYQMVYDKEDGLSLNSDRKSNDLLHSNLNIVDVLEEGDKVGIFYNFIPSHQENIRNSYLHTIERVKKGMPVDRNKWGIGYALKLALGFVDSLIQDISDVLSGGNDKKRDESVLEGIVERLNGGSKTKPSTDRKRKAIYLPTQILVMSESNSKVRQRNNAFSLAQSFDVISEDNRLVHKRLNKKKLELTDYNLGAEINKIGDEEAQNFIAMPGREILETHNIIDKVNTQETQVPEDLQKGNMRLGVSSFRGHQQQAYMTEHKEYRNLSTFIIGPQRSGKTTLIGNLTYDAIKLGECVVLFDFIENCEMSSQVASLFREDQVLNIVCDKFDEMQGLGYNEVKYSDDPEQQYINAKQQNTQVMTLVNSINVDDSPLTARMTRYLESAALAVFLTKEGSIKDVFSVLQNHNKRKNFIDKIPTSQYENMEEYIGYLHELDDLDKEGDVKGTKLHLVEGIISRLNTLKANPYMEKMLKKGTENNDDLVSEFEKNKLICIKMPEHMFNTDIERDIYTTYWATKIWLALQIRARNIPDKDKRNRVSLFVDELYQVNFTEAFLSKRLNRLSKFRMKPIVSCHYLDQLKYMKRELEGANASYLLLSGCNKSNFKELASELSPFKEEDLLRLPEHHSMNLIKNKTGYGRFITHLPPPVSENKKEEVKVNTDDIYINGISYEEVAATKEE